MINAMTEGLMIDNGGRPLQLRKPCRYACAQ